MGALDRQQRGETCSFQILVKFQSETALGTGCGICLPSGNPQGVIMWKPSRGRHSSLEPGKEDKLYSSAHLPLQLKVQVKIVNGNGGLS